MKVLHVITGLSLGGAETMLARLLPKLDRAVFESEVVSLTPGGALAERIHGIGVPVHWVGMTPGRIDLSGLYKLASLIRRLNPDVIHTWMYHANLAGSIASILSGAGAPVVWAIHHSWLDPARSKRLTIFTDNICSYFSRILAAQIVFCSAAAQTAHCNRGYDGRRSRVVSNGFDTAVFQPDSVARGDVRRELGIGPDCKLVGMFGRFHPQKDHRMFVAAAARLQSRSEGLRFLLCGTGVSPGNHELKGWLAEAGLETRTHLLGERSDIPRLTAALDVACLSSYSGEAFPLVLGEALACGVPCVSTDVGDSRLIVGSAGRIVPPGNPDLFASAIDEVLSLQPDDRRRLGELGRDRVVEFFDIDDVARRYEEVYSEVCSTTPGGLSQVGV